MRTESGSLSYDPYWWDAAPLESPPPVFVGVLVFFLRDDDAVAVIAKQQRLSVDANRPSDASDVPPD